MANGIGSDDEPTRTGAAGASVPGGDVDEDLATTVVRGVADGFAEASHAFSNELAGTNRLPVLVGRSVAGVIRANAKLLDEVATVVRDAADGFGSGQYTVVDARVRPPGQSAENVDYERLATMIAERLQTDGVPAASS